MAGVKKDGRRKSRPGGFVCLRDKVLAAAHYALEKKADCVRVLDMSGIACFCDYFVVAEAESSTKVIAIAEHIIDSLACFGIRPLRREGFRDGQWIVLDYVDVVVHVFQHQARRFYDLERLWGDAKIIEINDDKQGHLGR
ncbi:MAG: ribosome silencing factor [Candidatus Omnitrophica bacterium]|nr:ribosome silencing factor [Candidatus Omnitrophota bacterium]